MQVRFNNKSARVLGLCVGGKRLLPGKNVFELTDDGLAKDEISRKQMALALQNEQFRHWQSLGWVSVSQPQEEKPQAADAPVEAPSDPEDDRPPEDALRGHNLKDAKTMIAACMDQELLIEWCDRDVRKGVKEAVEDRLKDLGLEMADDPDDMPDGVDEVFGDPDEGD